MGVEQGHLIVMSAAGTLPHAGPGTCFSNATLVLIWKQKWLKNRIKIISVSAFYSEIMSLVWLNVNVINNTVLSIRVEEEATSDKGEAFIQITICRHLSSFTHRCAALGEQVFAIIKTCAEVGVLLSGWMLAYNAQGCVFYRQPFETKKVQPNNTKLNKQTNKQNCRLKLWI